MILSIKDTDGHSVYFDHTQIVAVVEPSRFSLKPGKDDSLHCTVVLPGMLSKISFSEATKLLVDWKEAGNEASYGNPKGVA